MSVHDHIQTAEFCKSLLNKANFKIFFFFTVVCNDKKSKIGVFLRFSHLLTELRRMPMACLPCERSCHDFMCLEHAIHSAFALHCLKLFKENIEEYKTLI